MASVALYRSWSSYEIPPARPARDQAFDAVKVFSITEETSVAALDASIHQWLGGRDTASISDVVVAQSSSAARHCISVCIFFRNL